MLSKLLFKIYLLITFYLILATGKIIPIGNEFSEFYAGAIILSFSLLFGVINIKSLLSILISKKTLYFLIVLNFVFLACLISDDFFYALEKLEGGLLGLFALILIGGWYVKKWGKDNFELGFIYVSLFVLVFTVLYRIGMDYQGRGGRYLLNGPIVFGWIMGFSCVLSLIHYFNFRKFYLFLFSIIFFVAVLYTQSKGPLVAVLFSILLVLYCYFGKIKLILFISGVLMLFKFLDFSDLDFLSRFLAIQRFFSNDLNEADFGSVSIRQVMWIDTLNLWLANPFFGVGVGNWQFHVDADFKYPHNILLEILVELGIVGFLFLFTFSVFLIFNSRISKDVKFIFLYFLICLNFSGDLSYLRFLLFYPLIFLFVNKKGF